MDKEIRQCSRIYSPIPKRWHGTGLADRRKPVSDFWLIAPARCHCPRVGSRPKRRLHSLAPASLRPTSRTPPTAGRYDPKSVSWTDYIVLPDASGREVPTGWPTAFDQRVRELASTSSRGPGYRPRGIDEIALATGIVLEAGGRC
jgi:hypothetical protein